LISKRAKRRWLAALLVPISYGALLLSHWLGIDRASGLSCGFVPCPPPWYLLVFVFLFYIGEVFAILAVVVTIIDFVKAKRGKIAGSSQDH
jgi:MFS family permease